MDSGLKASTVSGYFGRAMTIMSVTTAVSGGGCILSSVLVLVVGLLWMYCSRSDSRLRSSARGSALGKSSYFDTITWLAHFAGVVSILEFSVFFLSRSHYLSMPLSEALCVFGPSHGFRNGAWYEQCKSEAWLTGVLYAAGNAPVAAGHNLAWCICSMRLVERLSREAQQYAQEHARLAALTPVLVGAAQSRRGRRGSRAGRLVVPPVGSPQEHVPVVHLLSSAPGCRRGGWGRGRRGAAQAPALRCNRL